MARSNPLLQGQTATITVEEGVLGGEVWFFAFAKPLSQLPDSAPEVDITISGQETRSFSFKMLYQKVTVTSDTEGPVTAGDIITYTVRISTYPREDLEKSRLTLYPPLGTDLLPDSIIGAEDSQLSGGPSLGYSLKWDSNPPTTLEVIYKVQVWDIYIIDPSVKEIVTHPASYRIDAKGVLRRADNVTGDPIEDINFFSGSELTEPLVNKLERNELELTLTPSKTILEVDEEFTVTATIKTINFSRFENARLNPPSIKFLGDQVAELIESPTTFLPPLTNNQEGSLEYKFKALAEGTFRISAEAMATATGRTDPTTTDPVETEEICVGCAPVDLIITIPEPAYKIGDVLIAKVTVQNNLPDPVTVTMDNPLLITDKDQHLEIGEIEEEPPFILAPDSEPKEFMVPMRVLLGGIIEVFAGGNYQVTGGEKETLGASADINVTPLSTQILITPEATLLNLTSNSEKSARCLEIEKDKTGATIWTDCIEIIATIKNETDEIIKDVVVPAAANVLNMVTSTNPKRPNVPLVLLEYQTPAGIDPVTMQPKLDPTTLNPGQSISYIWRVGSIDFDEDKAEPAPLEIEVLSLGDLNGKPVRGFKEQEFDVVDEALLEWGIKNRTGRTNFLGGQTVWVDGYLENITEKAGKAVNLRVMIFQVPDGNVAGGFMLDKDFSSVEQLQKVGNMPFEYAIFDLPAEGDARKIEIQSLFRSMPLPVESTGKIKYVVRLWALTEDDEGKPLVTNADGQATVGKGWVKEFDVSFRAEESLQDTWVKDCELLDIPTWLCAMEQSFYTEFMEGILQLSILGKNAIVGTWSGYFKMIAYESWLLKTGWEAIKGDQEAVNLLIQDAYNQYQKLYDLGLLSADLLSQAPMAFEQFAIFTGDTLTKFFIAIEEGDNRELQLQIGHFLGANPDLLLEPIAALGTLAKLRPQIRAAARGLEETIEAQRLKSALRKNKDLDARIAAADANPNVRNLYQALEAGDELTDAQLLKIYGVSSKELKELQRIAKNNGVTLGFRSRNPVSVKLLEDGLAYPKPHALETFKSVNEIDRKYLGYRNDANGILEIVEPPAGLGEVPKAELGTKIKEYMVGLKNEYPDLAGNETLLHETEKRLKRRVSEWQDAVGQLKIENPNPTDIDVHFAGKKQYVHDVVEDKGAQEIRQIHKEKINDRIDPVSGRRQRVWKIEMTGPNGGPPKPVTGDIDFLAILDPNGLFLTNPEKRRVIYEQLAEAVGMQHGESYSFMFQKNREEWLQCCVPEGEPVMSIGPYGKQRPTAGFFLDNRSAFPDGPNAELFGPRKKIFKKGDGGKIKLDADGNPILVEMRHADPSGEFPFYNGTAALMKLPKAWERRFTFYTYRKIIADFAFRRLYFLPAYLERAINQDSGDPPQPKAAPGTEIPNKSADISPIFSTEGPVIQATSNGNPYFSSGSLSAWTEAGGWQEITPSEVIALGNPDILDFAPMTALDGQHAAGVSLVQILSIEEQGVTGDYFQIGDRVVINPGGISEESAVIKSLEPLEFTAPLIFDHESAEPIVFVERNAVDSDNDGLTDQQEDDLGTDPLKVDTDSDSIPDRAELAYGTDPLDPESVFKLLSFGALNGGESVEFSWTDEPGKTYKIEVSPDLSPGSWEEIVWDIQSGELITVDYFNRNSNAIFYRVRLND